ncbi:hypothetical protein TorRG33x02_096510 [Trema orientale]|uniref:Uncharacterized protein n=1 Tax=Trema orientale TaxID=63057 RepID=A0A2P5FA16_TREOI|nr:hypothetical protein TorRG33x02_096510 [Trema orientale]
MKRKRKDPPRHSLSHTETLGSATIDVARICSFILTQVCGQSAAFQGSGNLGSSSAFALPARRPRRNP